MAVCENHCGECAKCVGAWAQIVIDEKDAEIKALKVELNAAKNTVREPKCSVHKSRILCVCYECVAGYRVEIKSLTQELNTTKNDLLLCKETCQRLQGEKLS